MNTPLRFTVEPQQAGRIDLAVAQRVPGTSRRRLAALFRAGRVRRNGRVAKKGSFVHAGDEVVILPGPPAAGDARVIANDRIALVVLYQDDRVVAVAKPPGVASHPLGPGETDTLANALVARFPECRHVGADPREAGLVHRLDPGTSGVLLAARDGPTWRALRRAFTAGDIQKEYLAAVAGRAAGDGSSDWPLASRGPRTIIDHREGLAAATRWRVAERLGSVTLLECTASTGRRHQIRAHLAHAGLPIVGDELYGGPPCPGLVGHFLHAAAVALVHPGSGAMQRIAAPLPLDRSACLERWRAASAGAEPPSAVRSAPPGRSG